MAARKTEWRVAALVILLGAGVVRAEDPIELFRAGFRQTREGIKTLRAEFEIRQSAPRPATPPRSLGEAVQHVKWAQVGSTARWHFSSDFGNVRTEYLWKDDQLKVIYSQGQDQQSTKSGAVAPQTRLESQTTSPWWHAGFVSPSVPHDWLDISLTEVRYRTQSQLVQVAGRDFLLVTFRTPAGEKRREYWVDPKLNYVMTKAVVYHSPDGLNRVEREMSDFREVGTGIFFPFRSELRAVKGGKLTVAKTTEFKTVRVNEQIDVAELELRFPEGLPVADSVKNEYYLTDANEKPVPGSDRLIPLSKDEQLRLAALRPWYWNWAVWAWVGAGLVLVFIVIYVRRRHRSRGA